MKQAASYKNLFLKPKKDRTEFDISQRQSYLETFEELKEKGIILEYINFNSDKWIAVSGGIKYTLFFPVDMILKKIIDNLGLDFSIDTMKVAFKSYCIIQLKYSRNFNNTIISAISNLKYGIEEALKINERGISDINNFLSFIKLNENKAYEVEQLLNKYSRTHEDNKAKKLPYFGDIFLFSDIIDEIIETENLENYIHYFPVILWWKITSVLPLRPSEFISMKYDCTRIDVNGNFLLDIKRSKAKSKKYISNIATIEGKYYDETIYISEEIYNLINRVKRIIENHKDFHNNEFLISNFYNLHLKNGLLNYNRRINENRFTRDDLSARLKLFYEEIIQKKYFLKPISRFEKESDYTIERMTPYDSRHMAIINLVYIGTEPQSIMLLAGHQSIHTTENYFDHVYEYSQCYAISLARSLKFKQEIDNKRNDLNKKDFNTSLAKETLDIINNKGIDGIRVDAGICSNIEVINNNYTYCFMMNVDCYNCKFLKPICGKEEFNLRENKLEIKLQAKARLLKDLVNNKNLFNIDTKRTILINEIRDLTTQLGQVIFQRSEVTDNE